MNSARALAMSHIYHSQALQKILVDGLRRVVPSQFRHGAGDEYESTIHLAKPKSAFVLSPCADVLRHFHVLSQRSLLCPAILRRIGKTSAKPSLLYLDEYF